MLWQGGKAPAVLWPVRGSVQAVALGVNSHGSAVGYSLQDNKLVATLWKNGQDKGQILDQGAGATAINDSGLVVGFGGGFPLVWRQGKVQRLPGGRGMARTLSPRGVVGGEVVRAHGRQAALWSSTTVEPVYLFTPEGDESMVVSANDYGQAVGLIYNYEKGTGEVSYWEDGKLRPVSTLIPRGSNFTELFPRSVNNKGQLVGVGITKSGEVRGFVYTP